MKFLMLIVCVIPALVTSIQISPNGNSPEIKMIGGMMVRAQKGTVPLRSKIKETSVQRSYVTKKPDLNSTKLAINERYRRLIPYMTFYYANHLTSPTTIGYDTKQVEIQKAQILESQSFEQLNERQPKRIVYSAYRDIPRYQGNRLTQYNIASANPTKHYNEALYQNSISTTPSYNPYSSEYGTFSNYDKAKFIHKPISPTKTQFAFTRKPQLNYYNDDLSGQYYLSQKEAAPKYKLVPYEQTPPEVASLSQNVYNKPRRPIAVPVMIPKEQIYIVPRTTARPQYFYDNINYQQPTPRKQPTTISESYYEEQRPQPFFVQPVIESGFKPMVPFVTTTEIPQYSTTVSPKIPQYENERPHSIQILEEDPPNTEPEELTKYYQYYVDQPKYVISPQYVAPANKVTLGDLISTLQRNKSLPQPITKENINFSIRTLLQALNALKAAPNQNEVEVPILSTPKPFVVSKLVVDTTAKPVTVTTTIPFVTNDLHQNTYLSPVNLPSQHLDDYQSELESSQQFPLPLNSEEDGGTPGRPGVEYPALSIIPQTSFDCKTQRYKGFFADPETRCQVWHYCDLNGGQASFLCPNGTIFSQAALTCDWWFNVRCNSTTQLYVLNESLYKYILPHQPKFPEDYSGPLVDKYLTLKFKEMEEEFKKNKNKSTASEKGESDETDDSSENPTDSASLSEKNSAKSSEDTDVNIASVMVASSGNSGNVERLRD